MFEIRNLRYKDILYIERMNIRKGITTSITGRSGSGKTTLLKMLNKMISPDEGTILYEKKPVKNIDSLDLRRRVVMLPQSPVIFPGDIRDNLLKGLRFSEKPDAPDSRMNEIISELHLNKSLDDDISQLSGGEKQRIALARVILMDPEVYLLDEPSSALDEETEKTMIGMGIVFLPGMMTGQILSGTSPVTAIEYQIAIMLAILGSVSLSVTLLLELGFKSFFNEEKQLI